LGKSGKIEIGEKTRIDWKGGLCGTNGRNRMTGVKKDGLKKRGRMEVGGTAFVRHGRLTILDQKKKKLFLALIGRPLALAGWTVGRA
jgi:hypothetical protein